MQFMESPFASFMDSLARAMPTHPWVQRKDQFSFDSMQALLAQKG